MPNDDVFALTTRTRPPAPLRRPVIALWTLRHEVDVLMAQLIDHGSELGVELQFRWNGELLHARYFRTSDLAMAEADDSRKRHESVGWSQPTTAEPRNC